jgi:UDP-N-acetylmuramoyl-L-alanyl-D-glutamate--2,6-diaminopimelate ligase
MIHTIKKIIPKPLLQIYHFALAKFSAFWFRHPSNKLIVIGVTGTNGKSSTVQFIAQILTELGHKVGYTTTAGFFIAGKEIENKMKMTMPGRFFLQSLIGRMVREKCEYAVIETSSEGIAQFRHLGINYDIAVFTNLTPEHIESHGSFENYKRAKGKLFAHLSRSPRKTIDGVQIQKVSVINVDDEHSEYFTSFEADELTTFGWKKTDAEVLAKSSKQTKTGVEFLLQKQKVQIPLRARFQQENALAAIAAVHALEISLKDIAKACKSLSAIPGRFEFIDSDHDFDVIVDYAYEPYALKALFDAVTLVKPKRIIGVHGSAGGGRDVSRRSVIGRMAAEFEDVVVVTNEDPYDEDPREIIEQVAQGARSAGKKDDVNLFLIDSRMEAIEFAVAQAKKGDIVLLTGKGSEPVMAVAGGKKIPWSDKQAALHALKKI